MSTLLDTACHDLEIALISYLDGELAEGEAHVVELHLRECPVCRAEVAAHEQMLTALLHLRKAERAPTGLRDRIVRALDAQEALEAKNAPAAAAPLAPDDDWNRASHGLDRPAPPLLHGHPSAPSQRHWFDGWLLPAAATTLAAAAAWLVFTINAPPAEHNTATAPVAAEAARQLVRSAPLEVSGGRATAQWVQRHYAPDLALPVMAPRTGAASMHLLGARLTSFDGKDALLLQYRLVQPAGGRADAALQVVAYPAIGPRWPRAKRVEVAGRELYVDEHLGVRAVATMQGGYAYVFSSTDLSHNQLAELVAAMDW